MEDPIMTRLVTTTAAVCLLLFSLAHSPVMAETPTQGTVSGTGTVTIERRPTELVMHVQLLGKGKTLKEALQKLKDRREAAGIHLEALKAKADSIKFGEPTSSNIFSKRRAQFEMMIKQRMTARGGGVPKGLQIPRSYVVSASLTARWPLSAEGTEDLLIQAEELTEKIKKADLAGMKDAEKLSPEEEELMEELAEMSGRFSGYDEEQVKPGMPRFLYAAGITDQERDKAMAKAFAKARAEASRLAAAAGKELGPLAHLEGGMTGVPGGDEYDDYRYARRYYGRDAPPSSEDRPNESVSPEAGVVRFACSVRASFLLK